MTLLMGVQNTSGNISFQAENTESSAAHGYLMIQVSGIDIFLFHKDLIVEEYQMKSVVKFTYEGSNVNQHFTKFASVFLPFRYVEYSSQE